LENEKFDGSSGIHARKIAVVQPYGPFPLHTLAGYRPAKRFFARASNNNRFNRRVLRQDFNCASSDKIISR